MKNNKKKLKVETTKKKGKWVFGYWYGRRWAKNSDYPCEVKPLSRAKNKSP